MNPQRPSAAADAAAGTRTQQELVRARLLESAEVKRRTAEQCLEEIVRGATLIARSLAAGGKLLLCGNGGSAADCQHIAAELVDRLAPGRERLPWPAIALTANSSDLTAIGNDYGFEEIFARQVQALGRVDDVLVLVSTSGRSPNLIRAAARGRLQGLATIGLLGNGGGLLAAGVDVAIIVPSADVQRIQETHIAVAHIVCEAVEAMLTAETGEASDVVLAE